MSKPVLVNDPTWNRHLILKDPELKDGASIEYNIRAKEAGYFNQRSTIWSNSYVVCDKNPTKANVLTSAVNLVKRPQFPVVENDPNFFNFYLKRTDAQGGDFANPTTMQLEYYKEGRSFEVTKVTYTMKEANWSKVYGEIIDELNIEEGDKIVFRYRVTNRCGIVGEASNDVVYLFKDDQFVQE